MPIVSRSGSINFLEPWGLSRPVMGLLYVALKFKHKIINIRTVLLRLLCSFLRPLNLVLRWHPSHYLFLPYTSTFFHVTSFSPHLFLFTPFSLPHNDPSSRAVAPAGPLSCPNWTVFSFYRAEGKQQVSSKRWPVNKLHGFIFTALRTWDIVKLW